jgi:inosose dehydratase
MPVNRREFLASLAIAAVSARTAHAARARSAARIRFGYAAITWGNNELVAIEEISKLGYPGIQLRSGIVRHFVRAPSTLRDLLAQKKLTFVALSSGSVTLDPAGEQKMIAEHVARAKFLHDAGGLFLQVTDERPSAADVTPADCERLGALLTEIGRQSAEIGVPVAYHPHMGTIGEQPENADRVLAASDKRYVKLLLDVAHYTQGGGDPAAAIRRHRDRLALLHLKDVETIPGKPGFRFVELGKGRVNLPAIFDALNEIAFDGWVVVELDDVTAPDRSAAESAEINKRYLESRGFTVS